IRDFHVTGVQTCALPISMRTRPRSIVASSSASVPTTFVLYQVMMGLKSVMPTRIAISIAVLLGEKKYVFPHQYEDTVEPLPVIRSEERRVGKAGRTRMVE